MYPAANPIPNAFLEKSDLRKTAASMAWISVVAMDRSCFVPCSIQYV
jgi:hypothetical protein